MRQIAFAPVSRASVITAFLLFDFRRDLAIVGTHVRIPEKANSSFQYSEAVTFGDR
jgi:hypothetical protein